MPTEGKEEGGADQELVSDAEVNRLSELGDLYRHFRTRPDTPKGILRLAALQGGYSEEDFNVVWWAVCLAVVVEPEQEKLHRGAGRN